MIRRPAPPAEKLLLAALALALLLLGIPQTIHSAHRLYAGIADSQADGLIARGTPLLAQAAKAEALAEQDLDPQAAIRGGLLRLRLALTGRNAPPDQGELSKAVEDLRRGLAQAPADPRSWTALGYAELALGNRAEAGQALSAALFMARAEPTLTLSWCGLGLALWPELNDKDRQRIAAEIRLAWTSHRPALLELAQLGNQRSPIRDSLAALPGAQADFDAAMSDR